MAKIFFCLCGLYYISFRVSKSSEDPTRRFIKKTFLFFSPMTFIPLYSVSNEVDISFPLETPSFTNHLISFSFGFRVCSNKISDSSSAYLHFLTSYKYKRTNHFKIDCRWQKLPILFHLISDKLVGEINSFMS